MYDDIDEEMGIENISIKAYEGLFLYAVYVF